MTIPAPPLEITSDADWAALCRFYFGTSSMTVSNKIDFLNALVALRGADADKQMLLMNERQVKAAEDHVELERQIALKAGAINP